VLEPLIGFSGVIALAWAGLIAAVVLAQSRLIFGMPRLVRRAPLGPAAGAHEVLEVSLAMADGVVLRGWLARPSKGGGSRVAVYFGGRNEHVSWTPDLASWLGADWALCAFSYRGRAGSQGRASEDACVGDAVAQIRWAARQALAAPVDGVSVVGRSLGGAIAVLAAHRLADEKLVLQQALLSPPASIAEMVRRIRILSPVSRLLKSRLEAIRIAPDVTPRTLVLLADEDTRVPRSDSMALAESLGGQTEVFTVAGTTHQSLPRNAGAMARVADFLNTV
jgi:dienelactone hydrolase